MTDSPDQYGVIGHPVSHSWSPFIHGMFAKQTGQSLVYRLHDVPPERFRNYVTDFFSSGGRGLNITVPHKLAAAALAHELTPRARRAGAVNTLAVQEGNRVLGDNTDGAGLVRDLRENLGIEIEQRRILIAGAGGAARGVLAPLLELNPAHVVVANRTPLRAQLLVRDFVHLGSLRGCGFEELDGTFDLVINATSASLGGTIPDIPTRVLSATTSCYDMAYAKTETPFVRWAMESGCARAVQGWGMLVEQAAEAFYIWRGIRPPTAPVLNALREPAVSAS